MMADPGDLSDLDAHSVLVQEPETIIMQQPEETTVMNLPVSALSQLDKEESPIQVIFDPATQKLQLVRGASPQVIQQAVQQVPAEMPGIPAPVPEVAPVVPAVSPPQPTIKQVMRTGVPVQLVTTKSGQQIIQLQSGVTLKGVHLQPITTKDVDVGKEMIMGEPLQVKKSVVNQQVLKAVPVQTVKTLKLAPGQSLKGLRLQGGWRIQGGSDAVNPHARAVATGTMKTPQKRAPFGKPKASSSQARPSTPGTVYLSSSDGTYMPLQMTSVGGQLGYTIPADAVEPNKAFRIQTPAGAQLEGVVQAGDSQGMQLQIKQPPAAASSPAEVAMVEAEPEEEQPFTPNIKTNTAVDRVISFDSLSESQKRKILHQMKNPISDPMPAVVEQDVQQSPVLLVQQPALYESPRRGRPMSPDLELVTMKPPSAIMEGDIVPEEEEVIVTHMETPTLINEPTEGQQNGGWSLATTLEPQEQPVVNKKSAKKVRSLSFPVKVGGTKESKGKKCAQKDRDRISLTSDVVSRELSSAGDGSNSDFVTLPAQVTMLPQFPPGQIMPANVDADVSTALLQKVVRAAGLEIPSNFLKEGKDVKDVTTESQSQEASNDTLKKSGFKIVGCLTFGCGIFEQLFAPRLILPQEAYNLSDLASEVTIEPGQVVDLDVKKRRESSNVIKASYVAISESFLLPYEDAGSTKIGDRGQLSKSAIEDDCEAQAMAKQIGKSFNSAEGKKAKQAKKNKQQAPSVDVAAYQFVVEYSDQSEEDTAVDVVNEWQTEMAALQEVGTDPGEGASGEIAPGEVAPGEIAPGEVAPGEIAPGEIALEEILVGETTTGVGNTETLGDLNSIGDEDVHLQTTEVVQELISHDMSMSTAVENEILVESPVKEDIHLADLQSGIEESVVELGMSAMEVAAPSTENSDVCDVLYTNQGAGVMVALSEEVQDTGEAMTVEVQTDGHGMTQATSLDAVPEILSEIVPMDVEISEVAKQDNDTIFEDQDPTAGVLVAESSVPLESQVYTTGIELASVTTPNEMSTTKLESSVNQENLPSTTEIDSFSMSQENQLPAAEIEFPSVGIAKQEVIASSSTIVRTADYDDVVIDKDQTVPQQQDKMNTSLANIDNKSDEDDVKIIETKPGKPQPEESLLYKILVDKKDSDDVTVVKVEDTAGGSHATDAEKEQKLYHAYGCYFCPFSSWQPETIAEHWVANHLQSQPYICSYCNFRSLSTQNIEEHLELNHSSMPQIIGITPSDIYQQRIALEVCKDKTAVVVPSIEHRNYGNFGEDFLGRKNDASTPPPENQDDMVKVTFHCIHCSFDCNNIRSMREHIRVEHIRALPYHCPHCGTCFNTYLEAKRHVSLMHPEMLTELNIAWKSYLEISLHCLNSFFDVTFNESPIAEPAPDTFTPTVKHWSGTSGGELYCNYCSFKNKKLSKMWLHMRTFHDLPTGMICPRCSQKSTLKQKDRIQGWVTCNNCRCFVPISCNGPNQKFTLGTRMYMCLCCSYRTHERSGVLRHVKYLHVKVQAFSCPYCNYRGVEKPKVRMHVMVHHPAAPLVVLKNIRMLQKYYDVVRGLFKEVLLDKGMLRRYTPAGENAIDYGYDPNDDSVRPTLEEEEEEEEVNVEYVEQADDFDPAQVDTRRILEQSLKLSRAQGKNVKSFLPAKKVIGVKKSAASKSAASMSFNMSQIKNAIKVGGPPRPRPKKSKGSSGSAAKSVQELMTKTRMDLSTPNNFRYYMNQDFAGTVHFKCSICQYRCLDRSCMSRHVKYIHLKAHPHSCRYCEYSNVERTKVKGHSLTFHRDLEPIVVTDHHMVRVLGQLTKRYYVMVSVTGRERPTSPHGQDTDATDWHGGFTATAEAESDSEDDKNLVQPQGLPEPVVKVEYAEEGSNVLGYGEVLPEVPIKSEPESDGELADTGAVNLDLASMSENLTPVATKPRPSSSYMVSEDVDDDDDGWLDDIQQLLNFHKRELEQDDYLQESRPAKWLKIDEGTRADPKINMMPIVLVEDIVSKIMSSV